MLPGTIIHEIGHTIVTLLIGASVTKFSVIPSGNTLGHVEHPAPKIPLIGNAAISITLKNLGQQRADTLSRALT